MCWELKTCESEEASQPGLDSVHSHPVRLSGRDYFLKWNNRTAEGKRDILPSPLCWLLSRWLSTSLTLWPISSVPHVMVTPTMQWFRCYFITAILLLLRIITSLSNMRSGYESRPTGWEVLLQRGTAKWQPVHRECQARKQQVSRHLYKVMALQDTLSFFTGGHGTSEKLQSCSNLLWNPLSCWFQPAREYLQFMWCMKMHGLAHFNCVSDWDRACWIAEVVLGAYFSTQSQEKAPFFFFFIHMINKYGMRLWGQIGIGII